MAARLLWDIRETDPSFTVNETGFVYSWFRLCENCGTQIVDPTQFRFCCNRCSDVYWDRIGKAERVAKGVRPARTWKLIRREILERDRFTCRKCLGTFPSSGLEIHHIVPVSEGGDSRPENLITECVACHRKERSRLERAKRRHVSLNTFFEIPMA